MAITSMKMRMEWENFDWVKELKTMLEVKYYEDLEFLESCS